jgi:tetratricopeptide (TPR) repeat protein
MSRKNWLKELNWTSLHTDELRNAAYAYIRQGKYEISLPFFEALVVLDPENAYDLQTLGAIYVQINQPKKAIACLNRALQYDADHGATLLNLAKAFFMAGQIDQGKRLANVLQHDKNPLIAGNAAALIMCYP